MSTSRPVVLTIAGSDSGGGAGIQADLKTFTALGVFGTTAITAITAQNTVGVHAVRDLPPDTVHAQIRAVMEDLAPAAVKSGMLSSVPIIEAVAEELREFGAQNYVMDPVMVSETGHALLNADAADAMVKQLLPLASLVTPNKVEAETLSGRSIDSVESMRDAARAIADKGAAAVLIKGGHMDGEESIDVLYNGIDFSEFSAPRLNSRNTHGTGCTYGAAIASYLALGRDMPTAIREAKAYVTGAIEHGLDLGSGAGPVDHGWNLSRR